MWLIPLEKWVHMPTLETSGLDMMMLIWLLSRLSTFYRTSLVEECSGIFHLMISRIY